jgi:hypothetical protein
MVETPTIGDAMADAKTYHYEVFKCFLDTDQMVMVQIFRDPENGRVLHSQIAFKSAVGDSWGVPYQLEKQ